MSLNYFFKNKKEEEVYDLLEAIFEGAIDGVIAIDDRGIVEAVNPAAAKLFDYEVTEIVGNNIKMLMPMPDQARHDNYIENYQRTGIKKIIGIGREVKGLKKNGDVFPFRLSVSEVTTNQRCFYTGFIHDVSDLNKAKKQLEQMNTQLEELVDKRTEELSDVVNRLLKTNKQLKHEAQERAAAEAALRESEREIRQAYEKEKELGALKSRFVSMASHEFRTPLTTIGSSAALLARYVLAEQQDKRDKHIGRIKSSVGHLTGILNDFLSLSKLEEGKVDLQIAPINWEHFCDDTLEELQGSLKKRQAIVCQNEAQNLILESDQRLLKNIFFNLLSNAVKYSPAGATITVKSELEEGVLSISVKDEGIGIPKEEQQYLFTRFFRAKNAGNIQGTGLGLTIVKRYVDLLNGNISFVSEEGQGTTFTVKLSISANSSIN
ncbi:MAG: PAS domain-containing sensor histidine kinase [Bacteroidota bacterium]